MADGRSTGPTHRHPLTMGLRPMPLADWLAPHEGDAALLARRQDLIARIPHDVTGFLPHGHDAIAELAQQLTALGRAVAPDLRALGGAIAEDICVLTPSDGTYVLTAAVVCFPNRWRLAEKMGKPVLAVHAPVPEYPEKLARAVDRFLVDLSPLQPMARSNWGLTDTDELHLPESGPPVNLADLSNAWLRLEHQTFVKLPRTAAVVFAIRTELKAWRDVGEAERSAVLEVARRLSPEWKGYKSLTG